MATFKLTISDTKGRSVTRELKDADANQLLGTSIGTELDAAPLGLGGKLTITGGSDKSGVPMRRDVHSNTRQYVLLSRGVGLPRAPIGQRIRKLVRGGEITEEITQINSRFDGVLEEPKKEEAAPKGDSAKADKKDDSKAEAAPKGDSAKADKKDDSKAEAAPKGDSAKPDKKNDSKADAGKDNTKTSKEPEPTPEKQA